MRVVCVLLSACIIMGLAGCNVSKPYIMKMDRVDQKMDVGNRGYLKGTPPPPQDRGDLKRPFIAVDIDLPDINTGSKSASEEQIVETRREVTVVRETTPTMTRQKVTVKEEQIK